MSETEVRAEGLIVRFKEYLDPEVERADEIENEDTYYTDDVDLYLIPSGTIETEGGVVVGFWKYWQNDAEDRIWVADIRRNEIEDKNIRRAVNKMLASLPAIISRPGTRSWAAA